MLANRDREKNAGRKFGNSFAINLKILSHEFLGGRRSSAGSRLLALILRTFLLSAALRSSRLLWLWSLRVTGTLGEFYFTSRISGNAEKYPR